MNGFVTALRVGSLVFGMAMLCWLGLYAQPGGWDGTEGGTSRYTRSVSQESPARRPKPLSTADVQRLKNFGKKKLSKIFRPVLTPGQKAQLMEALKTLTDALDAAKIDYFLYGGTLLGSWRHHDLVPWDDDVDIIVNISDWQAVESLNFSRHTLNVNTLNRYKFYSDDAADIPGYFWKYPYIDVCFFGDNGTHLYDMDPTFSRRFVYDKSTVLPLTRRPLGRLMLKSPRDTEAVLTRTYRVDECQSRDYDHSRQKSRNTTTVSCKLLRRIYPFVIRDSALGGDDTERLYLDGELVQEVRLRP